MLLFVTPMKLSTKTSMRSTSARRLVEVEGDEAALSSEDMLMCDDAVEPTELSSVSDDDADEMDMSSSESDVSIWSSRGGVG